LKKHWSTPSHQDTAAFDSGAGGDAMPKSPAARQGAAMRKMAAANRAATEVPLSVAQLSRSRELSARPRRRLRAIIVGCRRWRLLAFAAAGRRAVTTCDQFEGQQGRGLRQKAREAVDAALAGAAAANVAANLLRKRSESFEAQCFRHW